MGPVRIWLEDDRILLSCGWYPAVAADCKKVAGARWMKERKIWSYPLSMQTLRAMRAVFAERLDPSPELWHWAKDERRAERATLSLSRTYDAELRMIPELSPVLAKAMASRTYQRSGARYIAEGGNVCIADEPGLGKTATALGGLMESDNWRGNHLVIAPKSSLNSVWGRQIEMWGKFAKVFVLTGTAKQRRETLNAYWEFNGGSFSNLWAKFLVVNPAMIMRNYQDWCKKCEAWMPKNKNARPAIHQWEGHKTERKPKPLANRSEDWSEIIDFHWDSVILDEAHKLLAGYRPSNVTQQTAGLLDLKANQRIALTGTPLRGQEIKVWGLFNWLEPKRFSSFWTFAGQYFIIDDNGFGKSVGALIEEQRQEFYQIVDRFVLRRTRAEVRGDLPLGQRVDVLVDLEGMHKKEYEEFERMGEVKIEEGSLSSMGVLSELTRMKQMAWGRWTGSAGKIKPHGDSPKMEWIKQFLLERGVTGDPKTDFLPEEGSGFKYVIASQFTEILEFIKTELEQNQKIPCALLAGSTSQKRRDLIQKVFQSRESEVRVLLLQTQTGGESIELDAWCDEMVICDETWVADDQVQLEGRINNRSGRVAPRTWWYLRTADTIDQRIGELNFGQHDLQHQLLDGRRGVEVALHLLGRK